MRPRFLEVRERHEGYHGAARAVHAVILFSGDAGWAAARALQARLLGDVSRLFSVRTFGRVYVQAVSSPYLVRAASARGARGRDGCACSSAAPLHAEHALWSLA